MALFSLIFFLGTSYAANQWIPFGDKEYYYQPTCAYNSLTTTPNDIQTQCSHIDASAQLAIGNTQSIRDFLVNTVYDGTTPNGGCAGWLGLFLDGVIDWSNHEVDFSDGSSVPFNQISWDGAWNEPNAPNNQYCFGFRTSTQLYHSVWCREANGFICERPRYTPCDNCGGGTSGPCQHDNLGDYTCFNVNAFGDCPQGSSFCYGGGNQQYPDCSNCWPGTSGPCQHDNPYDTSCFGLNSNGVCPPHTSLCYGNPAKQVGSLQNEIKQASNNEKTFEASITKDIQLMILVISIGFIVGFICLAGILAYKCRKGNDSIKNKGFERIKTSDFDTESTAV